MKAEKSPKVLLVDDDANSRLLIKEILIATNISIFESSSGQQALSIFERSNGQFDLVMMDICLPDYDGVTLLKRMLQINPSVPAIAISALHPSTINKEFIIHNFSAIISKPFIIHEFINVIAPYVRLQLNSVYWEKQNNTSQKQYFMFCKSGNNMAK